MVDVKPAKPVFESGYVNGLGTGWQQWDRDEQVPELQWPASVRVFARMAREDGRVSSLLAAIALPIRRTAWSVEANGASEQVTGFVAENLGLPIKGSTAVAAPGRARNRFSWAEHLQTALLMLQYGHSFFEQVYRIDDDGHARIRKLAPRPQGTISSIEVARDGGLIAVRQFGAVGDKSDSVIPVSRLVAYVRDPEPGVWIGKSLLRPAYKHWLLKDELMRMQAATARRNGMGVPVATAAEGASDADVQNLQKMASAYKGGANSGVGLPYGADLKLLGVQGNLPDMQQAIEYHDKQIALAGLAHFLNLDRGGSYALASVQADTFVQSVQTFAETVRDTANAHVVEDLVDVNFGADTPAPRIVFEEIGSRQDATASALKLLVEAGLLTPDEVVRATVRQSLGIPAGPADPAPPAEPPPAEPAPTNSPPAPVTEGDGA
ncbi:DUF935 family protein [Rhodococcus jostii]|uniref:phage portal protein family protein n=1 Tax=Rhodococcus jostii TaxID=132919 RepID=UPI0036409AE8